MRGKEEKEKENVREKLEKMAEQRVEWTVTTVHRTEGSNRK